MRPLLPGLRCGPRLVGQRVLDTQPAQPRGHVHLVRVRGQGKGLDKGFRVRGWGKGQGVRGGGRVKGQGAARLPRAPRGEG